MSELLDLQYKLQDTSASISQLERELTANPNSPIVRINLESVQNRFQRLEADFNALAARSALDVCRYRLFQASKDAGLSLRGLSGALLDFQQAVSALFDALKNGRRLRVRLSADVTEATKFGFAYAFPGSVGVVLTMEHERRLFAGDMLDDAISTFFSVARAPAHQDIVEIGRRLGPAPLRAIYKWANTHVEDGLGADIVWQHEPAEPETLFLQPQELKRLSDEIAATSEETVDSMELSGVLTGAFMGTKRFSFSPDSADTITGTFTDAINEAHTVTLPKRYRVRVNRVTKIQYSSDETHESWHLVTLEEV